MCDAEREREVVFWWFLPSFTPATEDLVRKPHVKLLVLQFKKKKKERKSRILFFFKVDSYAMMLQQFKLFE